jgi:RHS repeat-associated protein
VGGGGGGCRQGSRPDATTGARPPEAATVEQRQSALTALSRTGWTATASGSGTSTPASQAVDASTTTAWRANVAQVANTQFFQVNMGAPRTFMELRMDTTGAPTEYPRQFQVNVSNDGTNWGSPVATGTGTGAVTTIAFASQTAQYVKVTLTSTPSPAVFWSIYDFNVYDTTLSRTGWTATASSTATGTTTAGALDGSTTTRWSSTSGTSHQFQVDMQALQTFNQITLDAGSSTSGNFVRGYTVSVSNNTTASPPAASFTQVATGTGTSRFVVINFATQQARHVRINSTNGTAFTWSIEELNVNGQPTLATAHARSAWSATGTTAATGTTLAGPIDATSGNRWTANTVASGTFYQVDMATYRLFNQITIDAGTMTGNFPRSYKVEISNNASTWTQIASGTNSAVLLTVNVQAQTARHIKVSLTAANPTGSPWSIQEFNVLGPALSRTGWVATASGTGGTDTPDKAIDGNGTSRWDNGANQANGQTFTLDMGAAQVVNQLTLDAGSSTGNYPRGYSVALSSDGTTFGTPVATGTGSTQLVTINFLTQAARAIRITQTGTASSNHWSIHEINVWRIAQPCDTVTCTPSDQCHLGVCDANTGLCSNPNKPNGTTCDNGLCQTGEMCQNGTCTGTPVTCTAVDQCHTAGTCNPATGICSNPNKTNGATCDNGLCETGETCQNGTCTGTPVTCTALDQCHTAGTCNPATGACSNPNKTNGATCDNGLCQTGETCQNGTCTGTPVTCTALDQCHVAGTCNPSTGNCSDPIAASGTSCNDGNCSTNGDTCQAGVCRPGTPTACSDGRVFPPIIELSFGGGTTATAVNEAGDVVGYSGFPAQNPLGYILRGFRYTASSGVVPITEDGVDSTAWAINDTGVVSGETQYKAMILSPTNDMTTYAWGSFRSVLHGVNNAGQFTGFSYLPSMTAIRYSGTGQPQPLGVLPGPQYDSSAGLAIDNLGRVVGVSYTVDRGFWNPGHAILFTDLNGLQDLNDLAVGGPFATLSEASASNGSTIVGHGYLPDGVSIRAFRYREGGDVAAIEGLPPYNVQTTANGINQRGDIVGRTFGNQGDNSRAFIYTNEGQMFDLNDFVDPASQWVLQIAEAINDHNVVVGTGTRNGVIRGFKIDLPSLPCPASTNSCKGPGVRDPQNGVCSWPDLPAGTACNDNNACTQIDTCQNGTCTGSNPVVCTAQDQCHDAGTCDTATGQCSNPVKLDPAAGPFWTSKAAMTTPRYAPGGVAFGGLTYLFGGCNQPPCGGQATATVEAYDPAQNAWSPRAPMPTTRAYTAADTIGGIVYVVGGYASGDSFLGKTTLEAYNPVSNSWSTRASMHLGRTSPAIGAIGGKLYVLGGHCCVDKGSIPPDFVDSYDPGTDTWTARGPAPIHGFGPAYGVIGSKLYVAGGLSPNRTLLDSLDAYDPATDSWTSLRRMPLALEGPGATVVDGKLYVFGGSMASSNAGNAIFNQVFIYDPAGDSWSAGPAMTSPRYGAVATVSGETVLLAGGYTASGPLTTVEALSELRGPACNDGQACTQSEMCQAGSCQAPAGGAPTIVNLPVADLGNLGGGYSSAQDVNSAGVVVGSSTLASGESHAFRWPVEGAIGDLGLPYPGGASGVNDTGVIAGSMQAPDGWHAFRYLPGFGELQDLGRVGDGSVSTWDLGFPIQGAFGRELNNVGQVVGNYTNQGGIYGFRYSDAFGGGVFEDIGTLEGGLTYGWGIDDNGTVVGSSWVSGTPQTTDIRRLGHAVMFENPIAGLVDMNDLIDPLLGWTLIQAIDIAGDYIVGTGELNGKLLPFRYRISSHFIEPISGGWAGFLYGNGVNRSGDVVGWGALDAAGSQFAAYVYTDQLGFKRLNEIADPSLGWDLRIATSINDAGMIVGPGTHAGVTAPYRMQLPPGQAAICKARSTCGGDDGDAICLYSDGVVDVGGGKYVAVFGFDNAASVAVHPTINTVHLDNDPPTSNPQPPPPAYLPPGTHTGAFVPTFEGDHAITWTVNGESVTARASTSPHLTPIPIGPNGQGLAVVIGGQTIIVKPDLSAYSGLPASPSPNPPQERAVGAAFSGALTGKLSVSADGAAIYSVPITLPPGIAGMVPNLSFTYNSYMGNGIMGQGWQLGGLSFVYRCARTRVQDGLARPVLMDDLAGSDQMPGFNDALCIDGKRILDNGRTEIDDMSVIGNTVTVTKNGETRYYGSRIDTRINFPNSEFPDDPNKRQTAIWALDKVVDVWGNYYEIHYNDDRLTFYDQSDLQARGLIVTSIKYTGHQGADAQDPFETVTFEYQDRKDVRTTRFYDSLLPQPKRLWKVTTSLGTYTLNYLPETPLYPTRMNGILYCAGGSCLDPLTFDWDVNAYTWTGFPESGGQDHSYAMPARIDHGDFGSVDGVQFADLNADGRIDFMQSWGHQDLSDVERAWENNGHGWSVNHNWRLPACLKDAISPGPCSTVLLDFNNDGVLDVASTGPAIIRQNQPTFGPLQVWINHIREDPFCTFEECWQEQTGWDNVPATGWANIDLRPREGLGMQDKLIDVDGDHVPDLVRISATRVDVLLRKNNRWVASFTYDKGLQPGETAGLADLNRDGLPDLLHLLTNGFTRGYLNTGTEFSNWYDVPEEPNSPGPGKGGLADIDGDGLLDRLRYDTHGCNQTAFGTELSFSNGQMLKRQLAAGSNYKANLFAYLPTNDQICAVGGIFQAGAGFADINGDGLSDVVISHPLEPGAVYAGQLLVNTGSTFRDINQSYDTAPAWTQFAGPNGVPQTPNRSSGAVAFVDLNGDGLEDIATSAGTPRSWRNDFKPPLIKKFPNGLAKKSEVAYVSITSEEAKTDGVYIDTIPLQPGTKYFAAPIRVVKSVSAEDGTGTGTMATTGYVYYSLRASAFGRGPVGFYMVRVVDPPPSPNERSTVTDTVYGQAYPFTGMPISVNRYKFGDAGIPLATTQTRYCALNRATGAKDCTTESGPVPKDYPPNTSLYVYPVKITDTTPLRATTTATGTIVTVTDFVFDNEGNATTTTVTTTRTENGQVETNKKIVTNTYGDPDSMEEKFGKVTSSVVRTERPATGEAIEHETQFVYGDLGARAQSFVVPVMVKKIEEPNRLAPIEFHTAYGYDSFGHIVTTTTCGSDFTSCDHAGATNPVFDPLNPDPTHPQFRTTTTSYDPDLFAPPNQTPGTINSLNYGGRKGRFPVVTTNSVGHAEYYAYDPVKGVLLQKTGPNGIHTRYVYDAFGQMTSQVERASSASPIVTTLQRFRRAAGDPANVMTIGITRKQTGEVSWTYGDGLGRTVADVTYAFDGSFTKTTSEYDPGGRVSRVAKPFAEASGPSYFTSTHYDPYGRISVVDDDLGVLDQSGLSRTGKVTTTYFGSTVVTERRLGDDDHQQPRSETKNALGKVTSVTEGPTTFSFSYDIDGNLTDVTDVTPGHNPINVHTDYDRRGRKTGTSDPDMGNWSYIYNGFGELIEQTDAKGQTTRMTYDDLGRLITKTELAGTAQAGTSQWVYDTVPGGVGKLVAVVSAPDDRLAGQCTIPGATLTNGKRAGRSYTFNALGEIDTATECTDGENFVTSFQYDLGRTSRITYPQVGVDTFVVDYAYTNLGFLHYLKDPATDSIYWAATAMNSRGQVTSEYTRSGVETVTTRNPATGWTTASASVAHADGDTLIQSFRYEFDQLGNLRSRKRSDGLNTAPWEESFGYDSLNRLTSSQMKVAGQDQPWKSYILDDYGNILTKDGNRYTYGVCGAGPHATCGFEGGTPFVYDLNGNMTSGNDRSVTYNAANKVVSVYSHPDVSNGNDTGVANFIYGAEGNRVVQSIGPSPGIESARTIYVGLGGTGKSLYERTTRGSTKEHTQFIYAAGVHGGNAFALKVSTTDSSSNTLTSAMKYYHFDHLGSVTAISDDRGHVVSAEWGGPDAGIIGFDPWGARRSPDGLAANPASFNQQAGHREFTGHEGIPNVGLVNMNGRVYDPLLGRFLSPDPTIAGVKDPQAYNRYSYVLNNPLRYTDPTGYIPTESKIMIGVYSAMAVVAFAACSVTGVTCVAGYAFMAAAIALTAVEMKADGASWAQVGTMIGISVAAGYVGGAIGGMFASEAGGSLAAQIVGGAIAGGISSAITAGFQHSNNMGDDILEGATMGALSAALRWNVQQAFSQAALERANAQAAGAAAAESYYSDLAGRQSAAGASAAYESKIVMPSERASAFLPSYDPGSWNDGGVPDDGIHVQSNSNCYAYAVNQKGPFGLGAEKHAGVDPGDAEYLLPMDASDVTVERVRARLIKDGLTTTPARNGRLVYLVVEPGVDYHFYRLDNNGYFSHKPGLTPVTNLDSAGALISNPAAVNHDYSAKGGPNYTQPGGWFWVPVGFSFPF